ncbi:hypothetical protein A2954_04290 [Candidatus Roizmanbacteria bacterium RIFCSPLOWO2_01_FULL_37_12]|uniref:Probable transcriptional regulatory protein A2954_04290 n=1 Tax=Candidatus Roizmanbacteria bacterium RIFCSPLOWO2_01_FULL_37_12 TaxID=1802056 RepID=A0A1F7IFS4_9BACT|nr:MAG: hypothetical protein A3D76_06200 [Candidatus Roizmanbacteria bacterium RIFCSPHIGHO2_02_FULL_37_9b]OGK42203.1 MAG: hypothetical protein A2954_04290 [Candidatus Roizmanbacteria bacterium RIFCSPLOWO2_01_FULL_37_12]
MSGHNKWSKIKRDKGIRDKNKGNVFSKLARLITLAVIEGGGVTDPENNIKLRIAIEKAKSLNFPKENIERAIEKGSGPDRHLLKEVIYEAFGPGGISLIILATTDNLNRTLGEVRKILELHNGKLGDQHSVSYLFKKCGLVTFKLSEAEEKPIFEFADKINAFDFDKYGENYCVYFPYENLGKVNVYKGNLKTQRIEVDYKPNSQISIGDEQTTRKVVDLIDALENLDDVQKVFSNGKI